MIKSIKFENFNDLRDMRGADAARFKITYDDAESELLWMSKRDIAKNISIFPEHSEELNKGLKGYAGIKP